MRTSKGPSGTVKSAPSSTTLHSTAANSARCRATPELDTASLTPASSHDGPSPPGSTECVYRGLLSSGSIPYKPLLPAEEEPLSLSVHLSCSCLPLLCTFTPVWIMIEDFLITDEDFILRVTLRHCFGRADQINRGPKESYGLATFHAVTALFTRIAPMNSKESLPLSTRTYPLTFNSEIMKAMTYMYVYIYALTNAKCRLYTVSGSVLEPISLKEYKRHLHMSMFLVLLCT